MVIGLYRLYQMIGAILVITSVLIAYGIIPNPIPTTPFKQSGILAIENINVIPMDTERVIENQTVIIRNGRVAVMRDSGTISIPNGAQVVDGTGKYLIPGLMDMHVYTESVQMGEMMQQVIEESPLKEELGIELDFSEINIRYEDCIFPFIANGTTGIRVSAGAEDILDARDRVAIGNIQGPRMLVSSPLLFDDDATEIWQLSQVAKTPAAIRKLVREYSEAGYDSIATADPYLRLSNNLFEILVLEASQNNKQVIAKLPVEEDLSSIRIDAGINEIIDIDSILARLVEWDEDIIQRYIATFLEKDLRVTTAISDSFYSLESEVMRETFENPPQTDCVDTKNPFWLNLFVGAGQGDLYASLWGEERFQQDDTREALEARVQFSKNMLIALHEAGVPLLAGTGVTTSTGFFGESLAYELEYLVDAGLTPYEAMRTATANISENIEPFSDAGVVETGRRADLVILNANPLENIENVRDIESVIVKGRFLSREIIDQKLNSGEDQ